MYIVKGQLWYRSTVRKLLDTAALILQVADDHGGVVALGEAEVLGDSITEDVQSISKCMCM